MEFNNSKYCVFIDKNDLLSDRVISTKGFTTINMLNSHLINDLTKLNKEIEMIINNKIYNCKYISK